MAFSAVHLFLVSSIFIGCQQKLNEETSALNGTLLKISGQSIDPKKQVYFFFQLSGCLNCTEKMVDCFRANHKLAKLCIQITLEYTAFQI